MKTIILLLCTLLGSCDIVNDTAESLGLKKKKSKTHISGETMYLSTMAYLSSQAVNIRYSQCITTVSLPYTSCEGAPILSRNACVTGTLSTGSIRYYKYQAESAENLSIAVNPSSTSTVSNCVLAYKENKSVTTNSPVSDVESGQSLATCQAKTSVSMTAGAYRCISVHSFCDSKYILKLSGSLGGLTVLGIGAANTTLPALSQLSTTYAAITGTHASIIGGYASSIIPIGFNFTYFGQTYSNVLVGSDGILSFKNGSRYLLAIAPWLVSQYLDCNSSIQYTTTGTEGNRIFTVQWVNMLYQFEYFISTLNGGNNNLRRLNYQVKFYESSNIIEFIYGPTSGNTSQTTEEAFIYIRSGDEKIFMDAKTGSTTTTPSSPPSTFPASGTVYRFTP